MQTAKNTYYCRVPFSVGKRESRHSIYDTTPKLGASVCRAIDRKGEAFMLEGKLGAVGTTVEIQSASLEDGHAGRYNLDIRRTQVCNRARHGRAAKEGNLRTRILWRMSKHAELPGLMALCRLTIGSNDSNTLPKNGNSSRQNRTSSRHLAKRPTIQIGQVPPSTHRNYYLKHSS